MPSLGGRTVGAATSAGLTRPGRTASFVLLTFVALLAVPTRAHDIYTSWTEAVVHPDRIELTFTLARASALRLLPDSDALPPITPANFPDYLPRLKSAAPGLFAINSAGGPLKVVAADAAITGDSDVVFRLTYPPPAPGALRFAANYLFQLVDGHVGTLVITDRAGRDLGWFPVTVDQPTFEIKFARTAAPK